MIRVIKSTLSEIWPLKTRLKAILVAICMATTICLGAATAGEPAQRPNEPSLPNCSPVPRQTEKTDCKIWRDWKAQISYVEVNGHIYAIWGISHADICPCPHGLE